MCVECECGYVSVCLFCWVGGYGLCYGYVCYFVGFWIWVLDGVCNGVCFGRYLLGKERLRWFVMSVVVVWCWCGCCLWC